MKTTSKALLLVLSGAFAIGGCGSKQKPAEKTTMHTETTTETNTGEVKKTETSETKVQQPDGSQTVKRTDSTEHTVPAAPSGK